MNMEQYVVASEQLEDDNIMRRGRRQRARTTSPSRADAEMKWTASRSARIAPGRLRFNEQ